MNNCIPLNRIKVVSNKFAKPDLDDVRMITIYASCPFNQNRLSCVLALYFE